MIYFKTVNNICKHKFTWFDVQVSKILESNEYEANSNEKSK